MNATTAKVVLALTSLAFVGFGVAFLIAPAALFAPVGIELTTATGLTEIRAVYGGMNLGLGLFGLIAVRKPLLRMPVTQVLATVLGAIAVSRLIGVALAPGAVDTLIWWLLALEASGAVVTAIAAGSMVCAETGQPL